MGRVKEDHATAGLAGQIVQKTIAPVGADIWNLGGNWGGLEHADPKPLLIVSRFTVPYGADRSLFDMFYDPDEVVRWLKGRSINARLDNKMTKDVQKNGGIAVQVLDLDNQDALASYVVDLSWTG